MKKWGEERWGSGEGGETGREGGETGEDLSGQKSYCATLDNYLSLP